MNKIFLLKGGLADFEVSLRISGTQHIKKNRLRSLFFSPFFLVGKPQIWFTLEKRQLRLVPDFSPYWSNTIFLVPFKNGWTNLAESFVLLQYGEKSCTSETYLGFSKVNCIWGFPSTGYNFCIISFLLDCFTHFFKDAYVVEPH